MEAGGADSSHTRAMTLEKLQRLTPALKIAHLRSGLKIFHSRLAQSLFCCVVLKSGWTSMKMRVTAQSVCKLMKEISNMKTDAGMLLWLKRKF